MAIINWLVANVFTQTAVIIGGVALVGLIASKKPFGVVVQGFLKTVIGFYIFTAGVTAFIGPMNYFQTMVTQVLHTPGTTLSTEYMVKYGIYYGPVLFGGFLLHLLIERFIIPKKYRFVYMGGGQFLLRYSMLTTGIALLVFGVQSYWAIFAFGTILTAIWYSFQPLYVHKFTKIMRDDDFLGYGHSSSIAVFVTSLIAPLIGNPKKSAEDIKFPSGISFMRDMGVAMALVQILLMVVVGAFIGSAGIRTVAGLKEGGMDPWVWILIQAITFSAGFQVLTFGLRTMLGELMPAFSGIADRVIPGARPAMDVPTVFAFGPNSVIIGSTVSIFTFIVYMIIFNLLGWRSLFPMVPSLFMSGAGAAVFGNKLGGTRGAVLGGFIVATMMAFGLLLAWELGYNYGVLEYRGLAGGEPDDFIIIWPIVWGLGRLLFGAPLPHVL